MIELVDLVGVYSPATGAVAAGRVVSVVPYRAFDSRQSSVLAAGEHRTVSVGNAVVPSHAVAVVMTVTVTGASQSGHVTVLPTAADTGGVPVSSTVNFVAGSTRANQAVDAVTLDAARSVSVYAAVSTHVIIDVVGYVTGPGSPVSQTGLFRLLESPVSIGSKLAIPAGTPGTGFDVAGRAGVDTDAVGVALLAVVSNRTATTSNVTVVADGTTAPTVSSLNPAPGERTAIAVTSGLVSGRVRVVSSQVVDVELFAVGVYVTSITPTLTPASGVGPGVLGFDPLGRLTTTVTGGVTVGYSYLADGTRVAARIQGGGEVYYLGGIEATRTSGVWSQVRRTYPYAGVTIASRTTTTAGGTAVSWLLGDRQGSVTTTITTGTVSTRWYRPYGTARGPSPASPVVTTGFLGKHEDPSGLTHLDHRDYDPTTGTFITIDPLIATTGEPYQYATGNPTTLSAPNGLEPSACEMNDSCHDGSNSAWGRQLSKSNACIISTACDGQQLVNAIKFSKRSGLGGIVFGAIDVAYQGDWELHDGNWNPKDLDAAAHGAIAALMTGGAPVATPAIATMIERVAQRLLDNNDLYEQIDDEATWWDRNGSTVMTTAFITFAVIGTVATGGAFAAGAGTVIAGGVTWGAVGTAATVGTFGTHMGNIYMSCPGPGCDEAKTDFGVDLVTFGISKGTVRLVGATAKYLGYSEAPVKLSTDLFFDVFDVGASVSDAVG